MNRVIAVLFICALAFGCATQSPIKASSLVGMKLSDAIETYQLAHYTNWFMPNTPPDEDLQLTYFMKRGNLDLTYDGRSEKIASATYTPSNLSAAERIDACYRGWSAWVDAHITKKAQPPLSP